MLSNESELSLSTRNSTSRFAWNSPWMVALLLAVLVLALDALGAFRSLERMAYDAGVRLAAKPSTDDISIIAIDEQSIANIGRWPWSRDVHARLIKTLEPASVVGHTVFFLEPQRDAGLSRIANIRTDFETREAFADIANRQDPQSKTTNELLDALRKAEVELDTDRELAGALENHGGVVLGMPFEFGEPRGRPLKRLPAFVQRSLISKLDVPDAAKVSEPVSARSGIAPISRFGDRAAGVGHLVANVEQDGIVRQEPLVLNYFDEYMPSMSLLIAAKALNLSMDDITVALGRGVSLDALFIPTDENLRLNTFYFSGKQDAAAFEVDSFFDVLSGKIRPEKYRNRIVLVGPTAVGLITPENLPVGARTAPIQRLAHNVSTILSATGFTQPTLWPWIRFAAFACVFGFLAFVLTRLGAVSGALATLVALVAVVGTQLGLMASQTLWLPLAAPAALLLLGYVVLTTLRYLNSERGKRRSDQRSVESNRMLGQSYQEKGQLDRAFEAYRESGSDESTLASLYGLALDYERKRQFNKAVSVYEYVSELDPAYRDVESRTQRARSLEETVMLGSGGSGPGQSLLLDTDGSVSKPTLGRYTVEKELGKGAMGIVYLGRDPKIDRVVAIKTLDFSKEFDDEDLEDVKERFFREAQAAGRLRHPNIVTIYDAGEEMDLAYIAMEVLTGRPLNYYSKTENLLPVDAVLDLVAKSADALHYAHSQNIVHRDIKPGNIMYEPQTRIVKITDFGIARITDASKTKTGTVMGTPSYMSPEQLAGRKVDGRSDLFSLGVTLFLLLAGRWPFRADSLTNLMYQIANEQHPDILSLRPELPAGEEIRSVIDKVLVKDPDNRYQTGDEMAQAIRECIRLIESRAA